MHDFFRCERTGPKLKFKITRARARALAIPMNRCEKSGEFIVGLPCKYKNGYSQLFDAGARVLHVASPFEH